MRILPGNAQHIGARHSQQDSFGFADPDDQEFLAHGGFLAVVCDGMGGMEHGEAASKTAVRAFLEAYQRKTPEESIPAALERGVFEANREVLAQATQLGLVENMGTTLVAAAVMPGAMYYVSVGDSALFLVSGGQHRMVNHPHVFANLLDRAVARGVMSREDAESHPERDSLTSYIGTGKLEEIDRNVEPCPMGEGDGILLASDGMFKTLEYGEIQACLHGPPRSWPELLVEMTLAKHREYQDNVTVLSVAVDRNETGSAAPPVFPRGVERPLALDENRTVLIARGTPAPPVPPPAPNWTPTAQIPPAPPRRLAPGRSPGSRWAVFALILLLAAIAGAAFGFRYGATHRGKAAVAPAVKSEAPAQAPPGQEEPLPAQPKKSKPAKTGKPKAEGARPHAEPDAAPPR